MRNRENEKRKNRLAKTIYLNKKKFYIKILEIKQQQQNKKKLKESNKKYKIHNLK